MQFYSDLILINSRLLNNLKEEKRISSRILTLVGGGGKRCLTQKMFLFCYINAMHHALIKCEQVDSI